MLSPSRAIGGPGEAERAKKTATGPKNGTISGFRTRLTAAAEVEMAEIH
jgi:hypothetical protein